MQILSNCATMFYFVKCQVPNYYKLFAPPHPTQQQELAPASTPTPTLHSNFHYETYISISTNLFLSIKRTAMYGSCVISDLIVWENTKYVHFSWDSINTAHVQWIMCSPKGSHLIHWTGAAFSHIALKWKTVYIILCFASPWKNDVVSHPTHNSSALVRTKLMTTSTP